MKPQLKELPMDKVTPTLDNPRRALTLKDPALKELATSIKSIGLLHPVVVRPVIGSTTDLYDLRAGRRRYQAHQINKATTIMAIVRDMTDDEAREATALENLQREDLTPLEEGRSIKMLLDGGKDATAIASDIGKHVSWIHRRAKLVDLTETWVRAYEDPKQACSKWSAAHLALIARFEPDVQERIFKAFTKNYWHNADSLEDIQEYLNEFCMTLAKVPWDLKDDALDKKAGGCTACQKRAHACPELFETGDKVIDKTDRCLDRSCFKRKSAKCLQAKEAELRKKHPNLVLISYQGGGSKKSIAAWSAAPAKKTTKGALPAMALGGKDEGELKYITTTAVDRKTGLPKKRPTTSYSSEAKELTLVEKRQELNQRRWAAVSANLAERLTLPSEKASGHSLFAGKIDAAMALILTFCQTEDFDYNKDSKELWAEHKKLAHNSAALLAKTRAVAEDCLKSRLLETWRIYDWAQEAISAGELFDIDVKPIYEEICKKKEFIEPAEWTKPAEKPEKKSKKKSNKPKKG